MGYITDYTLTYEECGTPLDEDVLVCKLNEITQYEWDNGFCLGGVKWYEHHDHMITISQFFPETLFTLKGEGEESGDLWATYYYNGRYQEAKATIKYENFDVMKLKDA